MSTPRLGAAAAALPDGKVLIAGGLDAGGRPLASTEIYDPSTNTWTPGPPMGVARAYAAVTTTGGDILVAGGETPSGVTAATEAYVPASGRWVSGLGMLTPREQAVASSADGDVEVEGGLGTATSADRYGESPWQWTLVTGQPAVSGAAIFSTSGFESITAGGLDAQGRPTAAAAIGGVFYGSAPLAAMSTARYLPAAAGLDLGRGLVVGGAGSAPAAAALASAEIYDPGFRDWRPAAPLPKPRYGAAAATLPDGRVLVAGGSDGTSMSARAWLFTPPPLPAIVAGGQPQTTDATGFGAPPHVGDGLEGSPGWFEGDGMTYTGVWQRCQTTCSDIGTPSPDWSGTGQYTVSADDVGYALRYVVTATNASSSATVATPETMTIPPVGVHLRSAAMPAGLWTFDPSSNVVGDVVRDSTTGPAQIGYRVWDPQPLGDLVFPPQQGVANFAPGQQQALIKVPLTDHGVAVLAPTLDVALGNATPLPLVEPSSGVARLADPAQYVRDPLNPLALRATPPPSNPLAGAAFFADRTDSAAARQADAWARSDPADAGALRVIVDQPNTTRFGTWNGDYPGPAVHDFLDRVARQAPGTIPMLATYKLVSGHCGHWSDPPATQAAYHEWILNLAEGIGDRPAVLFLEMDSLITTPCLSPQGKAVRLAELHDAINVLSDVPHLVTYLDAGAADALPAKATARLLLSAGVSQIQGFFLNSTHFDWTKKEIAYGETVSRLTGGKHFVINTAENGRGPLAPRHRWKQGNEVLCDPPGRGLGPLPTWNTGYPNVDAFAWIANPGVSGGTCRPGAPPSGTFWPALALELVHHADFRVR